LDTKVLASAFTSGRGASREVVRRVLRKEAQTLISVPLFTEYEAVLARPQLQKRCSLTLREQAMLFDAFLSCTQLVEVYYRWRPNLPDEADNHVLEFHFDDSTARYEARAAESFRPDARGEHQQAGWQSEVTAAGVLLGLLGFEPRTKGL
jgi:putative PIN family toxin of toxin-antitoxin system